MSQYNPFTGDYYPNPADSFNGNRKVKRAGLPKINVGGTTLKEFIENYFFPFVKATLSISGGALFEIGTNHNFGFFGSVTMNDEIEVSDGKVMRLEPAPETVILQFGHDESYSAAVTFNPRQSPSGADEAQIAKYKASTNGTECGCEIDSSVIELKSVYPYFAGMNANDLNGSNIYSSLTKYIEQQGNKSIHLIGTDAFAYFAYPAIYPDLTSIKDQNGFEQISGFTKTVVDLQSSGLPGDWTQSYKVYKSNNKFSANDWVYQFKY